MIPYIKLNTSAQQRKQYNEKGAYGLEENILISDKELISKICKELLQFSSKENKTNNKKLIIKNGLMI